MIQNKEDLISFLECDKKALGIVKAKPSVFSDEIWKFEIALRKCEYYTNTRRRGVKKLLGYYAHYRYHKYQIKLGFSIPLNVFDSGLSIAHYGTIVVNSNAKIGKNCRILDCVNIGAKSSGSPIIGDNVYIGSGAKIIGQIKIANNVKIGAGAVVVHDIDEEGSVWAGVPAKKIN